MVLLKSIGIREQTVEWPAAIHYIRWKGGDA
jgi:hypothetical protein